MPSPFPGMDPYLEDPALWPDVHHELISVAREFLNRQLRPKYYVRVEERVYISGEDDPGRSVIIPDLRIGERLEGQERILSAEQLALEVAEPVEVVTLLDDEIHEAHLEIIDQMDRRVVTVIEVVSPTNKVDGSQGRESYLKKRNEVVNSPSHWVEVDLLRKGVPVVPPQILSRGHYFVHVSRVDRRPKGLDWPIRLTQRLPVVGVPLKREDPDVKLDLQLVLDTAYSRAGYDMVIDYRRQPAVPLTEESTAWADQLLRDKALR